MSTAHSPDGVALDTESARALSERICASNELRRAARLREFLRYVTTVSLDKPGMSITEQDIGINVFGRAVHYDTAVDNIVRVNASELRKRLSAYFEHEGAHEALRCEIPRGSYTLHFFHQPINALHDDSSPDLNSKSYSPELPHPTVSSDQPVASDKDGHQETFSARGIRPLWICLVLVSVIALLLGIERLRAKDGTKTAALPPTVSDFWTPFTNSDYPTTLVLADASLPIAQELLKRRITLNAYLKPDFTQQIAQADIPSDVRASIQRLMGRNTGSFTDFRSAQQILAIVPRAGAIRLEYARRLHSEAIRNDNLILVGSSYSNPWVEAFEGHTNFRVETDPLTRESRVVNQRPLPGESNVYQASPESRDNMGYGALALFPAGEKNTFVLLISGTTSEATESIVNFVFSEDSMRQIKQQLPANGLRHFEVLLRTNRLDGTALSATIVAVRSL